MLVRSNLNKERLTLFKTTYAVLVREGVSDRSSTPVDNLRIVLSINFEQALKSSGVLIILLLQIERDFVPFR